MYKNDNFLRALAFKPCERTPVWLMRQAGRFLPEYNAVRAKAGSFMALAKTPELACEVTLQPVRRFGLDAAIIFSDILTIPDAMGLELSFVEKKGPVFAKPVRNEDDVKKLFVPDVNQDLAYVTDAIRHTVKALAGEVPLIGFAGSPFTLACYMVEGSSSPDFRTAKRMLYDAPELFSRVLDINTQSVTDYLLAQIEAGVAAVQIFDTWGGLLSYADYERFSLAYLRQIIAKIKKQAPEVPVIIFTKGGAAFLDAQMQSGATALGLDATIDLKKAKRLSNRRVALQGNLDPSVLLASKDAVVSSTRRVLEAIENPLQGGFIFNLGHGVDKDTPLENVAALIETVHAYR